VLEALSRLSHEDGDKQVIEVFHRFAPTWLTQMPELLTREERVRLQSEVQGITQQRMLREMTQTLEALSAETPIVLLLEDLHWSDFSKLELISAIARRSEPARADHDRWNLSAGRGTRQPPFAAHHEAGTRTP
jgi:predicted ATPase